jgi:hypothetical protein
MVTRARVRLWLRLGLASLWAALLALVGLWAVTLGPQRLPGLGTGWWLLGLTALAMAQFVFAALVADRLFPQASVRLTLAFEGTAALVFVGGLGVVAVWVIGALA